MNCKDLSAKCLKVPLNVRVDKENSLEFLFIWSIYLYTILLVCALLSCTFMWPSVTYFPMLIIENKIKKKEIKKEIYIDLAVVASQWSEVAVLDS